MSEHSNRALFLYSEDAAPLAELSQDNETGTRITALGIEAFLANPEASLADHDHVVIASELADIKQLLQLARERGFVLGIVPIKGQDKLRRALDLPRDDREAIANALLADPKPMDFALCNGEITLFSAVIGWLPGLESSDEMGRWEMLRRLLRQWFRLNLYDYKITTANGKEVRTAATGCMVFERHQGDIISRLIGEELSVRDGKVGLVVSAPTSRIDYLRFLYQLFSLLNKKSGLPDCVGYLQSTSFQIEAGKTKEVTIDGVLATETPVNVEVVVDAARVNLGPALMEADRSADDKETVRVGSIPDEEEATRAVGNRVPFFSYASEEHFRELFTSLHQDASINTAYVLFIIVSTTIAALGLFLDNVAVIIGAMIIAPLMAPLGSAGMALLRNYDRLLVASLEKLGLGIALSLGVAALISLVFPYQPVTEQMAARLAPSLPDLFVAIFSGIAAAYARAHKEISQTLAGVAIAVALVPPLAVAGIGLGRGDAWFFGQAFLLFSTNLVGIILAETLTFRVMGFSSALHARRQIGAILVMLIAISIPLAVTSLQIAKRWDAEQRLEALQLMVNNRPVQIIDVEREPGRDQASLLITIGVETPLERDELAELRAQIEDHLQRDYKIKLKIYYLLGNLSADPGTE